MLVTVFSLLGQAMDQVSTEKKTKIAKLRILGKEYFLNIDASQLLSLREDILSRLVEKIALYNRDSNRHLIGRLHNYCLQIVVTNLAMKERLIPHP